MFSDVRVISKPGVESAVGRRGGIDYNHAPEFPDDGPGYWAYKNANHINLADKRFFSILSGPHGLFVVVTNPTARRDTGSRQIQNKIVLRARDINAALRLYDARNKLLDWSENRFHQRPGGSVTDLIDLVRQTTPTSSLEDLKKWQIRPIVEKIPNPEKPKVPSILQMLFGKTEPRPPRFLDKQVGIAYDQSETKVRKT